MVRMSSGSSPPAVAACSASAASLAASRGGKIKTALQILAISWYLWPFPARLSGVGDAVMAVAVVFTVLTGADYVIRAVRLRRAVDG